MKGARTMRAKCLIREQAKAAATVPLLALDA